MIAIRFSLLALMSLACKALADGEYPPDARVIKPDNSAMEHFKADFIDLCPRFYPDNGATDRPIFVDQTFQEDLVKTDQALVNCVYQVPTGDYQNIGVDAAIELGGDGIIIIDPIEQGGDPQ
ncbi:hypothetical protein IAT38_004968 [Cryptococcus sp. DSM 104549]